jgi:hypothetical protein
VSSSQIARSVLLALWIVAALTLTSAQLRVVARAGNRRVRNLVAWLVCTLVLGGLLVAMDRATGKIETTRGIADVSLGAFVSAAALAAGSWFANRPEWEDQGRLARFLTLFFFHVLVVLITAFPFI